MENVKQIGKIDQQQQSRQVSQSLAQFPNDEDSSSEEEVKGGQPQLKPKQRQSAIKIPDNKKDEQPKLRQSEITRQQNDMSQKMNDQMIK